MRAGVVEIDSVGGRAIANSDTDYRNEGDQRAHGSIINVAAASSSNANTNTQLMRQPEKDRKRSTPLARLAAPSPTMAPAPATVIETSVETVAVSPHAAQCCSGNAMPSCVLATQARGPASSATIAARRVIAGAANRRRHRSE